MTKFLPWTLIFAGLLTAAFAAPPSPSNGLLLVANKGDQTLGLIDPTAGRQIATVAEGGVTGHEVAASPDGKRAFVPIYGNSGVGMPGTDGSTLAVIDLGERKVIHTIDFGHGVRPHCAVFGPMDGLLYVTTELDKSVTIIDPQTLKIVGNLSRSRASLNPTCSRSVRTRRYGYTAEMFGPGTVPRCSRSCGAKNPDGDLRSWHTCSASRSRPTTAGCLPPMPKKPRLAVIDAATNKS